MKVIKFVKSFVLIKKVNLMLEFLNLKSNNKKNFIRNILNGKEETILATNHQLKKET